MMKSRPSRPRGRVLASLTAAFLVLCALPASSQGTGQPIRFPGQRVGPFLVGLDFLTPTVEVGQPLQFRLHYTLVEPAMESKFQVTWDFAHDLVLLITYPGVGEIRIRGANSSVVPVSSVFNIGVGETQWLEKSVVYVDEAFSGRVFEVPGVYPIQLHVRCGVQSKEPKILTFPIGRVNVTKPGPDSQRAIDFLERMTVEESRALLAALQAGRATPSTEAHMKGLIQAAPRSPLVPHALLALATKAFQEKNYPETVGSGLDLIRRFPGHLLGDEALYISAQAFLQMEKPEEARAAAIYLFLSYPETDVLRPTDDLYKNYVLPALFPAANTAWMLYDPAVAPTQAEWDLIILGRQAEIASPYHKKPPAALTTGPPEPSAEPAPATVPVSPDVFPSDALSPLFK